MADISSPSTSPHTPSNLPDQTGKPWAIHRDNPKRAARLLQRAVQNGDRDAIALIRQVLLDTRDVHPDALSSIGLMRCQHVVAQLNDASKWTDMIAGENPDQCRLPGHAILIGSLASDLHASSTHLTDDLRIRYPHTRTVTFRVDWAGRDPIPGTEMLMGTGMKQQDVTILTTPSQISRRQLLSPGIRHEVFSLRPTSLTVEDWMDLLDYTLAEDLRLGRLGDPNEVDDDLGELRFATLLHRTISQAVDNGAQQGHDRGATLSDIEQVLQAVAASGYDDYGTMRSIRSGLEQHRWLLDEERPDLTSIMHEAPNIIIALGGTETLGEDSDTWGGLSNDLNVLPPFVLASIGNAQRKSAVIHPAACVFQGCGAYFHPHLDHSRLLKCLRIARHYGISVIYETDEPGGLEDLLWDMSRHRLIHRFTGDDLTWLQHLHLDPQQLDEVSAVIRRLSSHHCVIQSGKSLHLNVPHPSLPGGSQPLAQ